MMIDGVENHKTGFSYSITGASKKNVTIDVALKSQHAWNLKVWETLSKINQDGWIGVYYPKMDAMILSHDPEVTCTTYRDGELVVNPFDIGIGDDMLFLLHNGTTDKFPHIEYKYDVWQDKVVIYRPEFCLAPFCRISWRKISLNRADYGCEQEIFNREIYDLNDFIRSLSGLKGF